MSKDTDADDTAELGKEPSKEVVESPGDARNSCNEDPPTPRLRRMQ